MKKRLLLALSLLVAIACQKAMAQASTEGKDFWVSSTIVCSPDKATATPYIAVSAKKACTVHITNPRGSVNITQNVTAGSWTTFNPTVNEWYPSNMNDADNVTAVADQINNYGLHVTATEDISVYVILSSKHSMDASNILPTTALQSEYYTQDFLPTCSSGFTKTIAMATILALEDNTVVDITPRGNTYGKNNSGQTYSITLKQGQTYYLMSSVQQQLTGTHIMAKNGKKIAVFNGVPLTNVPSGVAARDCLFEQSMPVDYWGNQFIVTRSLEKDGNYIGVTAIENGTIVYINGRQHTILDAGQTYYCLLQGPADPRTGKPGSNPIDMNDVYTMDALYIETSCPCAVFNYDTGNSFTGKAGSEIPNGEGDPSSVWISPLQQKIGEITFGSCYTSQTRKHFMNVVTSTATCQDTKFYGHNGPTLVDRSAELVWTPVPGKADYSYARLKIGENNEAMSVFTLENRSGFIAHVYGNGNDESYAYSCGSSAIKRGINLEGFTFTDGLRGENRFCINTPLTFDAQVGTDIIDKVDWDFGDGVTEYNGPAQTTHEYETKGWYDVIANVYAHKDCPETVYPAEAVHFSFYVDKAEIIKHENSMCVPWDSPIATDTISDTLRYDCDSIVINSTFVRRESKPTDVDITAKDSCLLHGSWIYNSGDYRYTFQNSQNCDSVVTYHVKIVYCLDINVPTDINPECDGQTSIYIPYDFHKGEIAAASFVTTIDGQEKAYPRIASGSTLRPAV
ncbi:MAG: IgGFc-binding protein, partial [Paludibacteraceae bacterium]|nr:IgGFc-binding protein [Paludibacteraceae bacterium]